MKKLVFVFTLLLLLLVVPASYAQAAQAFDRVISAGETVHEDLVIWGDSLWVEEGATVDGDISVFGGNAVLDGHVDGDVVIFGGTGSLSGTIDGDLVLFGGTLSTGASADVDGECLLLGGTLKGDGAGSISCNAVGEIPVFAVPPIMQGQTRPEAPQAPEAPRVAPPRISSGRSFFGTISAAAGQSLVFGILALVAAAVLPGHLTEVSRTLRGRPAASGAVGFLTLIAAMSLIVLLGVLSALLMLVCIGFLGVPVVIALAVALGAALLLGWIAAGAWLGERLAGWFRLQNRSLTVTAALGTAVLTLAAALLSALPFLLGGWLWTIMAILISCAGLGAVALTRFGTRSYPVGSRPVNDDKAASVIAMLPDDDEEAPTKRPMD